MVGKMKHFYQIVITAAFLLTSLPGYSQQMDVKIKLQTADQIQPQDKAILEELPRRLEDYINNYSWADEYDDILVKANINIIVTTMRLRGSERLYRSQFTIQSSSIGTFNDGACEFPYIQGETFDHQRPTFHPLLGIIDYYVNMLIGSELDTYLLKGGTQYFDRARNITDEGLLSQYGTGWKTRFDDQQLITDADHAFLRDAIFYFYEGLFYIEEKKDRKKAPDYSKKVVELLEQTSRRRPNSKILKRFFDAHHKTFCTLFQFDDNPRNAMQMVNIDNRHSETYQDCIGGGPSEF